MRFLWFDDFSADCPTTERNRFARVIFGVNSSPFLLAATLRIHLNRYNEIDPDFVKRVLRSLYADDFSGGTSNVENGVDLYKKLKLRFLEAGFNFTKWRSNSENLNEIIGKLDASQSEDDVKISEVTDTTEYRPTDAKMLGIVWDESKDEFISDFEFIVSEAQKLNVTKRNVLKVIASFYDPVGLIQPILVNMKLFLQTLFKLNLKWDEELAPDLKKKWDKILRELGQLKSIRIPRCYIVTEIHVTWQGFQFKKNNNKR